MSANLYTFVMDYAGGTYISQIRASNVRIAKRNWADQFDIATVGAPRKSRKAWIQEVRKESVTRVKTVRNVWCFCADIGRQMAIVHVIRTFG